jgi:hypothetical protein
MPATSPGGLPGATDAIEKLAREQREQSIAAINKSTKKQLRSFRNKFKMLSKTARKAAHHYGPLLVKRAVGDVGDELVKMGRDSVKKIQGRESEAAQKSGNERQQALVAATRGMKQDAIDYDNKSKGFVQMMEAALKGLAKGGEIKVQHISMLRPVIRKLIEYHKRKDLDFGGMVIRLEQGDLTNKDWENICALIHKNKYVKVVKIDRIEANIVGTLVAFMTRGQRYQTALEMEKRHGADEAYGFAKSIAENGLLYGAQLKSLYEKIFPGKKFSKGQDQDLIKKQKGAFKKMVKNSGKMRSGMHLNYAEVSISMRGGAARMLRVAWGAGAALNFAGGLRNGLLSGITDNPWTAVNLAGVALATHYIQKQGGTSPEYTVSFLDDMIIPPVKKFNPFGKSSLAEKHNNAFKELAGVAGTFQVFNEWLMDKNGSAFQVLNNIVAEQQIQREKHKRKMAKSKKVPDLYDKAIGFQKAEHRRGGGVRKGKGEKLLEKARRIYGKIETERILRQLARAVEIVGIRSYRYLHVTKCPNLKKMSLFEYYKRIQGMDPRVSGTP